MLNQVTQKFRQINDRIFEYKDETLSLDGEVIADNIKFDNEQFYIYVDNTYWDNVPKIY